jgi:AcrR family transcriptional regulator
LGVLSECLASAAAGARVGSVFVYLPNKEALFAAIERQAVSARIFLVERMRALRPTDLRVALEVVLLERGVFGSQGYHSKSTPAHQNGLRL